MANNNRLSDVDVSKKRSQSGNLTITRSDLDWAAEQNQLDANQAAGLWSALVSRAAANVPATTSGSKLDLAQLMWYGGAGIVMLAMGWFLVSSAFNAVGLLATSVLYAVAFAALGHRLYFKQGLKVPGGLMFTVCVGMVPVITAALMNVMGVTDMVTSRNALILEAVTIVAGVGALRFVRFPFLTMPVYTALWLMIWTLIDLMKVPMSFGDTRHLAISMAFGGILTFVSVLIDRRSKEDFAFWGYFFGVTTFWFSLTFLGKGGPWGEFVYFAINVALMLTSVVLQRRIFLLAGSLGAGGYILYQVSEVLKDSMWFPFGLAGIGIALILLGVLYHRNRDKIENAILSILPAGLVKSLPRNRGDNEND
jgi:hypothetical protein